MPGPQTMDGLVGAQPAGDIWVPTTDQNFPLGQRSLFYDPAFGYSECIYGKAAAAISIGRVVRPDGAWTFSDYPNTANLGSPWLANVAAMGINTFGWFRRSGAGPVQVNATVAAAAAIGLAAAGVLGTNTAGKQALNCLVIQPQTYAPTLTNCLTKNASKQVMVSSINGLFIGLPVSGTGIPGSTTIAGIDPSGNAITLNNAATATGQVTLTFTWTGFTWVFHADSFIQGAIT